MIKCIGKNCPLTNNCSSHYVKVVDDKGKPINEPDAKVRSTYIPQRGMCFNQNGSLENVHEYAKK
jgi:hypothetical protein